MQNRAIEIPEIFSFNVTQISVFALCAIGIFAIIRPFWSLLFRKSRKYFKSDSFIAVLYDAPKNLLMVGVIGTFIGVLVLFGPSGYLPLYVKLGGAFITEVGFAFIIAFILHVTVDFHARREKDREMSRGIISYIYGNDLDNEVFKNAEMYIFESPFYRRKASLDYEFLIHKDGKILLKQTFEYEVWNTSSSTQEYHIVSYVEKSENLKILTIDPSFSTPGLSRIFVHGIDVKPEDVATARDAEADSEEFYRSSHPVDIEPGGMVSVKTVSFSEKYLRDSELWRSLRPCDGIRAKIRCPLGWGVKMAIDAVHPLDGFDFKNDDNGVWTVEINRPLFPHNGIHFWWEIDPPMS